MRRPHSFDGATLTRGAKRMAYPHHGRWRADNTEEGEVNRNNPAFVQWIQESLNQVMGLRLAIDGILGPATRSAIRGFQARQGLTVDGIIGPITEAALRALLAGGPGSGAAACAGIQQPSETLDGFAFDNDRMPPVHQPTVNRIAACIAASHNTSAPIRSVLLVGHTDPVGDEIYNLDLSFRRAEDVKRRLRSAMEGVKRGSSSLITIEVDSCGETHPVAADNARNRRVEVFVPLRRRLPSTCPPFEARIRIHAKVLQEPTIPITTMLNAMRQVYGAAGFLVELASTERLSLPDLTVLDVGPCNVGTVTTEQQQLFAHRNNAGSNDIVVYFVQATIPPFAGCAAHPPGQPGAVIVQDASEWVLSHEVGHVLGLGHVNDSDRLMHPIDALSNLPPDLVPCEIRAIDASPLSVDC